MPKATLYALSKNQIRYMVLLQASSLKRLCFADFVKRSFQVVKYCLVLK